MQMLKKTDIVGAGHPRLDDTNYTLFDLNNIATLDSDIDRIGAAQLFGQLETTLTGTYTGLQK